MGAGIYVAVTSGIAAGYAQDNVGGQNNYNYNTNSYNQVNGTGIPTQRFMMVVEFIADPSYDKKN